MGKAVLKIIHAGPLVTIQDKGRFGYMRYGVTQSGPMDRTSFHLANYILGNVDSSPAIEISLGGLTITCTEGEISGAIVGGAFGILLNGNPINPLTPFTLRQGSTLQVRPGPWGSWCYLALKGSLTCTQWLGSRSTHLASGLCGSALTSGNILALEDTGVLSEMGEPSILPPQSKTPIRVVLGPQDRFFSDQSIECLTTDPFKLTNEYDRMGVRLDGPKLEITQELNMPSEPIARGSLQVPGSGQPICLLADHQTAGGYPKIATVISSDLDNLVQMRAGDTVRFKAVTVEQANAAARQKHQALQSLKDQLQANKTDLSTRLWNSNLISGVVGPND